MTSKSQVDNNGIKGELQRKNKLISYEQNAGERYVLRLNRASRSRVTKP